MHAPLLPPYMAMYARMHAPLLLPCGPCMRACMPHCCPHKWPCMRACMPHCCPHIWPCMRVYMPHCYSRVAHIYAYACPITAPVWPIYARIYAPLSGTKIRIIRKAVKKRQALYLIWTSAVIRGAIGHIWGHI